MATTWAPSCFWASWTFLATVVETWVANAAEDASDTEDVELMAGSSGVARAELTACVGYPGYSDAGGPGRYAWGMVTQSLRTMLSGVVDYAGLFPPAGLAMAPAAEAFARDRGGLHEWMLGRFVCPVSRLRELSNAAGALMPGTYATSGYREHAEIGEPWRVSVIADGVGSGVGPAAGLEADLETIIQFNTHHATEDHGLAQVDCIEIKGPGADFVDAAVEMLPDDLYPFFEVPLGQDPRGFVAALAGNAAAAKLRTGGVTAGAFPSTAEIAEFIGACRLAEVPFKATAGLHHPLRGAAPLTYEPGAATCVMHGFLNVFVASAFAFTYRLEPAMIKTCLEESDASAFIFTDEGLSWRRHVIDVTQIARVREVFALSFGSCSFDEPVAELKRLGLM